MSKALSAAIIPLPLDEFREPVSMNADQLSSSDLLAFSINTGQADFLAALIQEAKKAAQKGISWLLLVDQGQTLHPEALRMVAPALHSYEAIWGAMSVEDTPEARQPPKLARYCCSDFVNACHMALHWWVGRTHFVRTKMVLAVTDNLAPDARYIDYFIALWRHHACLKTAQVFSQGNTLTGLNEEEKSALLAALAAQPAFFPVTGARRQVKLVYTGRNPTIERIQLRGIYYEQEELEACRKYLKPKATILDVGANTGNHTVFFAAEGKADRVLVFEANPDAVAVLKATLRINGLDQVDTSLLGLAIGAFEGRARVATGRRGHLGSARLQTDKRGDVRLTTLDALVNEPVDFIKIDVEGMEMDVLAGASKLIERFHPTMMIEVQDENIPDFLSFVQTNGYEIKEIFADGGYANYFLTGKNRSTAE